MTLPVDLALLETAAASAAGAVLGLAAARASARREKEGAASRAERTFLLVWLPPSLARLATMLPLADPRTSPELAIPIAAPAAAALAFALALSPVAWRAARRLPAPRRTAARAAGLAASASILAAGLLLSPFDSARLADALADHGRRCAALARPPGFLRPEDARRLEAAAERERKESAADAGDVHARRGLAAALARLEERRSAFEGRARSLAASLETRGDERLPGGSGAAPLPSPAGQAPGGTPGRAGCAAVEAGMPAREVARLLGQPDQRVSAEDVRGPRAERWAYARLLCRVHLVDGVVEFVD